MTETTVTAGTAVPILMYHAVSTAPNDATRDLSVTPEAFAEQMAVIDDLGLTPVDTAALAASWRDGRPLPARPVLITFDDGYAGVHRHALPALAKHGFTASLFVTTGWIEGPHDNGEALDTMLGWDQVRELAAGGVEIGGHSHTHPQLDMLDDDRLRSELRRCRQIVADELGTRPSRSPTPTATPAAGCASRCARRGSPSPSRSATRWPGARRARTRCGG